jgi:hypothetical protein
MRRALRLIVGLLCPIAAVLAAAALAQDFGFMSYYNPYYGDFSGYGGFGGTAEGNELMGMSTVIRSAGEYNYYTSMAGVNNEEARSQYLDNKKKWQENYFQMREQRSALDAQKRARARQSREALYAATISAASRSLSPGAFDYVTGQIQWPKTLLAEEYATPRRQLEQLFELRATTSQAAGTSRQVLAATKEMARILRSQVQKIPASEYMTARKFIDGLDAAVRSRST